MSKTFKIFILTLLFVGVAGFGLPAQILFNKNWEGLPKIFQSRAQEELLIFVKEEKPLKAPRPLYVLVKIV